ncbi:hypothetical protein FAD94_002955 [Enterococcus faecalis]|uniref:hypothetical protein n=1 Tax=Enterococcus faecalis TaxID=1351 RepID=UPI000CF07987|nr:hypothetical protein [Enterococcus faecalis]EGO8127830.1 hypothetical protein [Enterococcus faecalis]MCU9757157.1 hypothetical protein [Enterococcus faecalis]MCU9774324.1 hypothetical protein [Enterococcus faecalis]MCU9790706.1 hypothetical protein [Enterococcus faecalis]PQC69499.1 hypothetical protein CUN08_10605 [Enterococcus faecalis]
MKYLRFEGKENTTFDRNLNYRYYNQIYKNQELVIDKDFRLILKSRVDNGFKQEKLSKQSATIDDMINDLDLLTAVEQLQSIINQYPIINKTFDKSAFIDTLDTQVLMFKLINIKVDNDLNIESFEIVAKYIVFDENKESEINTVRNILYNIMKSDDYSLALFQKIIGKSRRRLDSDLVKVTNVKYTADDKFKLNTVNLTFLF